MKLGIFGGTFNPIHYGHLRAAEEVREKFRLDKILFVPSGSPPLKDKELADARHRYKMVRLAIFKNRFFELSDIELKRKGKSYTVDTLKDLRRIYPRAKLFFILGIDAFIDIPNWRQPEKLIKLADFVVISRPDFKFEGLSNSVHFRGNKATLMKLDTGKLHSCRAGLKGNRGIVMLRLTPIDISATGIRERVKQGKSIKYLLPEEVESYIISNKLYKAKS